MEEAHTQWCYARSVRYSRCLRNESKDWLGKIKGKMEKSRKTKENDDDEKEEEKKDE